MAPEQRNDQFSSEPWRVAPSDRDAFLTRFLSADFTTPAALADLRRSTGRDALGGALRLPDDSIWVQGPDDLVSMYAEVDERLTVTRDWIPPSPERGTHVAGPELAIKVNGRAMRGPCPVSDFVAFYADVQKTLRAAHSQHRKYLEARKGGPSLLSQGLQFALLKPFLDDAPLDAARRPTRHGKRGEFLFLEEPLRGDHHSLSLVGELALATFHRFIGARESVVCPSCGELQFFPDVRGRQLCSKDECRRWYRAKWMRGKYEAEKAKRGQRSAKKTTR